MLDVAERLLGVKDGEMTPDGKFTFTKVKCLGCCAIGPVMQVDNDYYGGVKQSQLEKILTKYD